MISSPHLSQVLRDLQRKDKANRSAEHPRSPWRMPYPTARNGRVTVKMRLLWHAPSTDRGYDLHVSNGTEVATFLPPPHQRNV
jgi:hypothetical protein